jgi:hypothetical protein
MRCILRRSSGLLTVMAVAALSYASSAQAQEEAVRLDDLRAQLSQSAEGKRPEELDAFAVVEGDVDAENEKLAAQEREIMAKLAGKTAPEGDAAAFVVKGRELAVQNEERQEVVEKAPAAKLVRGETLEVAPAREKEDTEAIERSKKEISTLKSSNADLNRKLTQSQGKLTDSQRELKESKDRLMMAEAEIQRLSQMLERRNLDGLSKGRASVAPAPSAPVVRQVVAVAPKAPDDLPVATVVVEKANLRTGPGTDNSSLMSVSRGTRLVVETRNGSWYRVFAPNGTRAWVTGDVLSFAATPPSDNGVGSALRVRAYDPDVEGKGRGRSLN